MTTQVRFSECRPDGWRAPRPYMIPDWFSANGLSNPLNAGRKVCIDNEPPRRADRLPQKYASGTPTLQTATVDNHGVHRDTKTDYEILSTPEGSLRVPVHFQARHYTPSVDALDFLTHTTDTRLQARPLRYYR